MEAIKLRQGNVEDDFGESGNYNAPNASFDIGNAITPGKEMEKVQCADALTSWTRVQGQCTANGGSRSEHS